MILGALLGLCLLAAAWWAYTPDRSREALDALYAPSPSDYLDVAGLRLHVRDTGPRSAPPIILLHGFGSSLLTWEAWAKDLERDHRVIRYDLPGFGLTGPDPTGDYSEARGMAVLAALMDRLGVPRAVIIGNSMGGKLAWEFAADHPDRVTRLALVSPDGFASDGFAYGEAPKVPAMLRLLPYAMPRALFRMTLEPAYAEPAKLTEDIVTRYYDMALAPGVRRAIIDRLRQTILRDPLPALSRIAKPTLLLWGERDAMIPIANAADYLKAMPAATLVRLPGVGHVPQEEAPEASLIPLRAFLDPHTP